MRHARLIAALALFGSVACDSQPTATTTTESGPEVNAALAYDGDDFRGSGGRPLAALLLGSEEVTPGDPDGNGLMQLRLNAGRESICFLLATALIDDPNRAHIHEGARGTNGPVVVFFFDEVIPTPIPRPAPAAGTFRGCVSAPRDLIREILRNPADYYINVHNDAFPAGAIRGQLTKRRGAALGGS